MQHTPTCIIRREDRRHAQQWQINNYDDGEHNRVVGIWIREATGKQIQELLLTGGKRIHRSPTEKCSVRFFNYLICWVMVRV